VITVVNNCGGGTGIYSGNTLLSGNPLIASPTQTITVSVTPGAGQSPTNVVVSQNGAANQTFPFGGTTSVNIGVPTGPITITVNCGAANFAVTVNTNPTTVGATVNITGKALGAAPQTYSVPSGSYAATANTPVTGASDEYRLKNWSLNGVLQPTWTSSPTPAQSLTGATTFTANYERYFKVTLNLSGGCTATTNSPSGWVLAGASFTSSVSAPSDGFFQTTTINGANMPFGPNGTVVGNVSSVSGPITINATCSPYLTLSFCEPNHGQRFERRRLSASQ
jgi:hypothetical protein